MSLNTRIKERREQLDMSRSELADKIGVTPSAIANYENGISSPKIELLYKLFSALDCDANYLYQDEMDSLGGSPMNLSYDEMQMIKKYRELDAHGKEMVDIVLEKECDRMNDAKSFVQDNVVEYTFGEPAAAHERTDIEVTEDMRKHDDDIMDDDNF